MENVIIKTPDLRWHFIQHKISRVLVFDDSKNFILVTNCKVKLVFEGVVVFEGILEELKNAVNKNKQQL